MGMTARIEGVRKPPAARPKKSLQGTRRFLFLHMLRYVIAPGSATARPN
jgi:hypothetical protein